MLDIVSDLLKSKFMDEEKVTKKCIKKSKKTVKSQITKLFNMVLIQQKQIDVSKKSILFAFPHKKHIT